MLVEKTLGQILDDTTAKFPKNDALVYVDRNVNYTYEEFKQKVELLAKGLIKLGIKKGDKIAV